MVLNDRDNHVKHLGIYLYPFLSFNGHYISISKIEHLHYYLLGFINRSCYNFGNPLTLKSLYYAFVRPV